MKIRVVFVKGGRYLFISVPYILSRIVFQLVPVVDTYRGSSSTMKRVFTSVSCNLFVHVNLEIF